MTSVAPIPRSSHTSASAAALFTPAADISTTHVPEMYTDAASPASSRATAAMTSRVCPSWRRISFVGGLSSRSSASPIRVPGGGVQFHAAKPSSCANDSRSTPKRIPGSRSRMPLTRRSATSVSIAMTLRMVRVSRSSTAPPLLAIAVPASPAASTISATPHGPPALTRTISSGVARRRGAAALHWPEDSVYRLVDRPVLNLATTHFAEVAMHQRHVVERVDLAGVLETRQLAPFAHDDAR